MKYVGYTQFQMQKLVEDQIGFFNMFASDDRFFLAEPLQNAKGIQSSFVFKDKTVLLKIFGANQYMVRLAATRPIGFEFLCLIQEEFDLTFNKWKKNIDDSTFFDTYEPFKLYSVRFENDTNVKGIVIIISFILEKDKKPS
jgi:hypothetical protein